MADDPDSGRGARRAPGTRPDQILDAAAEVLLAKGLQGMTMDEIAGAAGLAKGTTYLYFKSKAQVLAALRTRHVRRMLEACDTAESAGRPMPAIARVERFVQTAWDFTVANAALLRLLFHEAGGDGTEIGLTRDALTRHLHEGVAAGEFAIEDPAAVAGFLIHGMHGTFAEALHDPESDHQAMLAATKAIFRRQLLGTEG